MPNDIVSLQNLEPSLKLLRARSYEYRLASSLYLFQFFLTVTVPFVAAIIGVFIPEARPYVAFLSLLIAILDISWLDRQMRAKLKVAALISEEFDCDLLRMAWNSFVAGRKIDPEAIHSASIKWKSKGDAKLINWYPAAVSEVDLPIARIICQRTNLWYDSRLRRSYVIVLIVVLCVLTAILLSFGILTALPLLDLIATIGAPLTPIFIWALRDVNRQRDVGASSERVFGEAEKLWAKVLAAEIPDEKYDILSREFQDAILLRRVSSPLMLPFVYYYKRNAMEDSMNAGARELVRQLRKARPSCCTMEIHN